MGGFALSRRSMISAGIGGAALATLGDIAALAQSDVRLRMFWWGAKERAERTDKVNQLYQQSHPGVTISGESLGWTDYWPRLATQTETIALARSSVVCPAAGMRICIS